MSSLDSPSNWRLIPLYEGTGAAQMAIDSWLLDQHTQGLQPSILRFYTWSSPTISLGYHQRHFPSHWNTLTWQGKPVDIVRRPTGGRAVLHQNDLTYAVITSAVKGSSRRQTYQRLCQFLIQGWQQLGVSISFGTAGRGYIKNPNCFGTATAADLVTKEGCKLIGSAQVYRQGSVLQHGSIQIGPSQGSERPADAGQDAEASLYEKVFEEKPRSPFSQPIAFSKTEIVQALTLAAQQDFEVSFKTASLARVELAAAKTEDSLQTCRWS